MQAQRINDKGNSHHYKSLFSYEVAILCENKRHFIYERAHLVEIRVDGRALIYEM
jgi:hypothetical protein